MFHLPLWDVHICSQCQRLKERTEPTRTGITDVWEPLCKCWEPTEVSFKSNRHSYPLSCLSCTLIGFVCLFYRTRFLCVANCPRTSSVDQSGLTEIPLPLPPSAGIEGVCNHHLAPCFMKTRSHTD